MILLWVCTVLGKRGNWTVETNSNQNNHQTRNPFYDLSIDSPVHMAKQPTHFTYFYQMS